MQVRQYHLLDDEAAIPSIASEEQPQLVLVFGSTERMASSDSHALLTSTFPDAEIVGCSTSGEITGEGVQDDTLTITTVSFSDTTIKSRRAEVASMADSRAAGVELAEALNAPDLEFVLVISDGLNVNGSSLVDGLRSTLPPHVPLSGGLAGDADRFERTLTIDRDGIHDSSVIAIGLYGTGLKVRTGSMGGWAPFGSVRTITKSTDNVVFEIDGERALDVYSKYLGDEAADLPASGLLFPLALSPKNDEIGLIRTLLAVDRDAGSLTFAGDVPEGTTVQLMHANFDQLVAGAESAATKCTNESDFTPELALLVSCVGRKLLLGNNIDFEVDAVGDLIGLDTIYTGFYSYGEIGPFDGSGRCELHNQTMTIALLAETA